MTELSLMSMHDWKNSELEYFHHALNQILPYLNAEGLTIHKEIMKEIEVRGGLHRNEADWTHGTRISYD